jgi:hypothetical protein
MKNFTIVRIGNEYVVRANEKKHFENRKPAKSRKNHHGCGGAAGFADRPAIVAGCTRRAINHA